MGKKFEKREGPSPFEMQQLLYRDKYEAALEMELDEYQFNKREDSYLIREFFLNLNETMTLTAACRRTGISSGRLKKWRLEIGEEFEILLLDFEKVRRLERLEETLYERAKDPDNMSGGSAAMFLLKGRQREVYGDKVEIDSRVTVQLDLSTVRDIRAESRDRIRQLRDRGASGSPLPPGAVDRSSPFVPPVPSFELDIVEAEVLTTRSVFDE